MSMREPKGTAHAPHVPVKGGIEWNGTWLFAAPPYTTDRYGMKIWGKAFDGSPCMVVDLRGWGYLTGQGTALKMPGEQAIESQKAMAEFICAAMNAALGVETPE